jgi:hypothetical protein
VKGGQTKDDSILGRNVFEEKQKENVAMGQNKIRKNFE